MIDFVSALLGAYALLLGADLALLSRRPPLLEPLAGSSPLPSPPPRVSIVVPARNSERTVKACVDSLLSVGYEPTQVVVVEGGSSDGTKAILGSYGPRITLVEEGPLPSGWVGKNWACHRGYLASDGDYLLFTDSDTVHSPGSLATAVSYAEAGGIGMLSLGPRARMLTKWERAVLPVEFMVLDALARHERVNEDSSKYAWGIGTFMLFRRGVYESAGGHEAVRDKIDEDVRLATLARSRGVKVRTLDGSAIISTSMYDSFASLFEGLTRNTYGMAKRSWRNAFYALGAALFRYFLPFVALGVGVALLDLGEWVPAVLSGALAALAYAGASSFVRKLRSGTAYSALLPASSLLVVVILVVAMVRAASGAGVRWKGRVFGAG